MTSQAIAQTDDAERRRFFRIDDRVAINVRILDKDKLSEAVAKSKGDRYRQGLLSQLEHESEKQLPQLRVVEKRYPEVARYLKFLEKKIDHLATSLVDPQPDVPNTPKNKVNISAQGIRFEYDRLIANGSYVELAMRLFPSRKCLVLFGRVIWCRENEEHENGKPWTLAVDYIHIDEADKELLIKHIHGRQLDYLRKYNSIWRAG